MTGAASRVAVAAVVVAAVVVVVVVAEEEEEEEEENVCTRATNFDAANSCLAKDSLWFRRTARDVSIGIRRWSCTAVSLCIGWLVFRGQRGMIQLKPVFGYT